jgi:hypothetical protein
MDEYSQDPFANSSPPGVEMPWTMTWGIDNPLLNIGAYAGVAAGAKLLSGGRVGIPFLGAIGQKQSIARGMLTKRIRGSGGKFVKGGGRAAFNRMWDLKRRFGARRWMSHVGARDLMSAKQFKRYRSLKGLAGTKVKFGNRAVTRRMLLQRSLTKQFGLGMTSRIMGYRALTGLMTMANVSFFAYLGGSALGAVGEIAANWTPSQPINARRQLETGGPIIDTATAFTQRQRAIQAIHNTQLSTRAALGNEASFMHYD